LKGTEKAYLFEVIDGEWTQQAVLDTGDRKDAFSAALALDSETVLVGAPSEGGTERDSLGAAYIFERTEDGWTQTARLTAGNRRSERQFGTAVALDGEWAVVGSRQSHCNVKPCRGGRAHVYARSDGAWTHQTTLIPNIDKAPTPTAKGPIDWGIRIALDGDRLLVGEQKGAPSGDNFAGVVSIFEWEENKWRRQATLPPHEYTTEVTNETATVELDGEIALLSIIVDLSPGFHGDPKTVFLPVFERTDRGWHQQSRLIPPNKRLEKNFGTWPFGISLAMTGGQALVGDPHHSVVHVFSLNR